jgi:hypothetical protein
MLINSKHERLSNEEIIDIASQETKSQYSPEQVRAAVIAECQQPGAILMRQGNTLFVVHRAPSDENIGVFRALNADTAENYLENSQVFIQAIKTQGFKTLVTTFEDPTILNIFKAISRNPPFPGMGYAAQRMKSGKIRVIINMGGEQQGGLASIPRGNAE